MEIASEETRREEGTILWISSRIFRHKQDSQNGGIFKDFPRTVEYVRTYGRTRGSTKFCGICNYTLYDVTNLFHISTIAE
jgi:adenylate kinase family enzyme